MLSMKYTTFLSTKKIILVLIQSAYYLIANMNEIKRTKILESGILNLSWKLRMLWNKYQKFI